MVERKISNLSAGVRFPYPAHLSFPIMFCIFSLVIAYKSNFLIHKSYFILILLFTP